MQTSVYERPSRQNLITERSNHAPAVNNSTANFKIADWWLTHRHGSSQTEPEAAGKASEVLISHYHGTTNCESMCFDKQRLVNVYQA